VDLLGDALRCIGCYATIATLIPVLTTYPLLGATVGDILGGAFVFALAGFVTALPTLDSGSQYAGIGASRATMVGILGEPTLIFVFGLPVGAAGDPLTYESEPRPFFDLPAYRRLASGLFHLSDAVRATQSGLISAYLSYILAVTIAALVFYSALRRW